MRRHFPAILTGLILFFGVLEPLTAQVTSRTAFRIRRSASAPAACIQGDVYFNTTSAGFYICTATNTFTILSTGAGVTATGTPVDNQIAVWDSASSIEGDSNLTWSGSVLGVTGSLTLSTDLTVPNGGTGVSTFTDGGVLLGSGSSAITATAVLGDGEILIGDASTDPVALDVGSSTAITILGTVATGTWQATDVGVPYGGTGVSTLTDGGVLLGSAAAAVTATAVLTNGQLLIGDGTGDPTLATITAVANETTVTNGAGTITIGIVDPLAASKGGSGAASFTDGGLLLGSGSGTFTALGVATNGQIPIGDGTGDPTLAVITGTTNEVDITNGAGTIQVGLPSNVQVGGTLGVTGVWTMTDATSSIGGVAYEFPPDDGDSGEQLQTDGSGTLTWESGGGGGNVSNTGTPANNQVAIWTAATTIEGDSDLTFDGTDLSVTGTVTGGKFIAGTDGATAGDVTIDNTNNGEIIWEGSTADGNENILRATDGAGVNTLPASTGTILTTAAAVSVSQGGTGVTSLTDGGLLLGSGTGGITALGVAANGQIPIGDGSTDPQLATLTGTSYEVDIANGGGSITIGLPDDVTIAGNLVVSGVGPHAIGSAVWGEAQLLVAGTFPNSIGMRVESTLQPDVGESSSGVMFLPTIQEQGSGTHGSFYTLDVRPPTITGGAAALTTAATVRISDDPSAAGNNYSLLVEAGATRFGAIGANDGHVHILSPATGTSALVLEMPASATANGLLMQYNGSNRGGIYVDGGNTYLILSDADLGNDAPGAQLIAGRNTNSTNSGPGTIRLTDIDGTNYYTYSDNAGLLRTGTTAPRESTDTSNTIVGTQTSFRFHSDGSLNKIKIRDITPQEGFDVITKSRFTIGKYANGAYSEGEFIWPYAEESPWLMQDPNERLPGGRSHSPISHSSLNSLAIQALNQQIEVLKNEIETLKHRGRSGLDVAGIQ
jgi:hypothetical protein